MGSETKSGTRHRVWSPKVWLGIDAFAWAKLLIDNRFAVDICGLPSALAISLASVTNTGLRYMQELVWGNRIRKAEIHQAPVFIVGHWRAGTTWLHELLTLDPRFTYPTTYQCFSPNHFLLTEWCFTRAFRPLLPSRRPMDDMVIAWDRPQEDEFALCNLGVPSPYFSNAFPNRLPQYPEYFDLHDIPAEALDRWKTQFMRFLRMVTLRNPGRIVLKSPTHTYRIKVLLDLFPDARFVHIVRDPFVLFSSTLRMWQSMSAHYAVQHPKHEGLEEYVFENFLAMYKRYDEARPRIPESHLYELRYEDLVKDPIGQIRAIYSHLDLGDFAAVLPRLELYLANAAGYATNRYELSPELRDKIAERWGPVIRRYGYSSYSTFQKSIPPA